MEEEKKKNNTALIILVILLTVVCLGMGGYIFISKDKSSTDQTNSNTKETLTSEKKNINENTKECTKISYDLNTNEYGLTTTSVGISINVDNTRRNVRISTNAYVITATFGLGWITSPEATYEEVDTKTFDKKITQVLVDGSGQDSTSATILYLMEDGTVEYVPILKDINTNWSQADNTKKFNSYGKLNGVSDIISLLPASANGYHTVLARKVDGTVIDLSNILKATGNFN